MTAETKAEEIVKVVNHFEKFLDEACNAKATYDTIFFVLLSYIFGELTKRQVPPTEQLNILKTVGARYWEVATTTTTTIN